MRKFIFYFIICFAISSQALSSQARTDPLKFGKDRQENPEKKIISARKIADRIKMHYSDSKIIDIQRTKDRYGNPAYKVKLLTTSGHRIDILVDARNGAIIKETGG